MDYINNRFAEERQGLYLSDKFINEYKETATYNGIMPSSIKVLRIAKNKVETVNFKQDCRVVMVCEEGYEDRQTDYKKAFAIAIKHFGWFRVLKPHGVLGSDIRDTSLDQVYNPELRNPANYPKCDQAMHDTWSTVMVNSEKRIFKPLYYNEGAGANYGNETQYKGRMYEWQVWKKLIPGGRNYEQVLKYYYSNCTGTSAGTIIVCSSHSGTYTNITRSTHYVEGCTKCKAKIEENHTWRLQGQYNVCSKCDYSIMVTSTPSPAPKTSNITLLK